MRNLFLTFAAVATFILAVGFGSLGQFWNATGWTALTFAIIMLIIQHENHKAELAKKDWDNLTTKRNLFAAEGKIELQQKSTEWYRSEMLALKLSQIAYTEDILKAMKSTVEALPTAEELEDPELREFYSLVIEEIKYQNL